MFALEFYKGENLAQVLLPRLGFILQNPHIFGYKYNHTSSMKPRLGMGTQPKILAIKYTVKYNTLFN